MKYLLIFFISIFFFSLTYVSAAEEFHSVDLVIIGCLSVFVIGLEILIARLFIKNLIIHNLILAGFTTINILYVNLVMNMGFMGLPRYGQLLTLLLGLFILNAFMNMLTEFPRFARLLPAIFALATGGILAQTLFSVAPVPEVSTEQEIASAKNIRIVDFKTKPNVYFISFDALIPKKILKKHLGLETTPYHDLLDVEFRRFSNFFADRIPTRESLNSLLALDLRYFSETERKGVASDFFPGLIPSPLFEIFKHNGYETNTFYNSGYLGNKKGPHVDNYFFNDNDVRRGACEFVDFSGFKVLAFFGYCSVVNSEWFKSNISRRTTSKEIDFFIESLKDGVKKDIPQVFVAYIYSPGHTPSTFDNHKKGALNAYRKAYLDASKETAVYFNKLITFIKEEDPGGVLYVFGDHGPWISRQDSFLDNKAFFIQDRFAVYGGIYPPDRCEESFSNPYNKKFMTVLQGAHMIIRCLSGGENAFITQEDYSLPTLTTTIEDEIYRYEDYLYE